METIKLSGLNPNTYIVYGNKMILATAELLLANIYKHKCRTKNAMAIIDNKSYQVEFDVKPEQIKETYICCNCGYEVEKNKECPNHPVKIFYDKNGEIEDIDDSRELSYRLRL